jgi:hypothetical protein
VTFYYTVAVGFTCTSCGENGARIGDECYDCLAEHFTSHPEEWPEYQADAMETPIYGEHDVAEIKKRMTDIAERYLEGEQS